VADWLVVTRNSFPGITGNWFGFATTTLKTPITVTDNVVRAGAYGMSSDASTGPGLPALTASTTIVAFAGNVIEKNPARSLTWPAGNTLLAAGTLAALLDSAWHYSGDTTVGQW
jgi:hypothetical protein